LEKVSRKDVEKEILTKYRTVAVVGLSKNSSKPSYVVAEYLRNYGFRIIPVNPTAEEILGREKLQEPS
jgi:predicted CoA-binding protein